MLFGIFKVYLKTKFDDKVWGKIWGIFVVRNGEKEDGVATVILHRLLLLYLTECSFQTADCFR